jgi:hypothetical protein
MSISSMASVAIQRKEAPPPPDTGAAIRSTAAAARQGLAGSATAADALDALMAYIPTEILVLYVAVLAAAQDTGGPGGPLVWWPFFSFLVATPIVVWLVYAGKLRGMGRNLPLRITKWPKWEMVAATAAYVAWALALPETPFRGFPWYNSALAGVAVLVVSAVLGLLAPIFVSKRESPA